MKEAGGEVKVQVLLAVSGDLNLPTGSAVIIIMNNKIQMLKKKSSVHRKKI